MALFSKASVLLYLVPLAGLAADLPLAGLRLESGSATLSRDGAGVVIVVEAGRQAVLRAPEFAVQPDTIYRVYLTASRTPPASVSFSIRESGGVARSHRLAFAPGYRPVPPRPIPLESAFATSSAATGACLVVTIDAGRTTQPAATEVRLSNARYHVVGPVRYAGSNSANWVLNAHCERAEADGTAAGYDRWGGRPDAAIERGAGVDGSSAIRVDERYLLFVGRCPALSGRRYRVSAALRGSGRAVFELRAGTAGHQPLFSGTNPSEFELDSREWQRAGLDTVALPGQETLGGVIDLRPAGGPIWVDNVELIEVGRPE